MNYPQSGKDVGPAQERIQMRSRQRTKFNAAFVQIICGGLDADDDLWELSFPTWETVLEEVAGEYDDEEPGGIYTYTYEDSCPAGIAEDRYEKFEDSESCVICGAPTGGRQFCQDCGA